MKFVFPFGDDLKQHVCPVDYRTLDGCCEPPNSMYTHSKRIGCCRTPNFTQTFGANTRCCTPEGTGQTRWGQTKDEPCGQLCSLPSTVLTDFGTSSCCPSCAGDRWNKTAENICGDCCTAPSSVSYVGAYSSCCAELPLGQNRWGQTTSSVCGGYCPPTSSVYDYNGLTSCCPTCDETILAQTPTDICGVCKAVEMLHFATSAAGTHPLNNLEGEIRFIVIGGGGGAGGGSGKYGHTVGGGGAETAVTINGETYTAGGGGGGYGPHHVTDSHLRYGGGGGGGGRSGMGQNGGVPGMLNGGNGGGADAGKGGIGISQNRVMPNPPATDGVRECTDLLTYAGYIGRGGEYADGGETYRTLQGKGGITYYAGSGGGGGVTCFTLSLPANTSITVQPGKGGFGGAGTWPGNPGRTGGVVVEYLGYK